MSRLVFLVLLSVICLSGCDDRSQGDVYVVDPSGKAVTGASVWVSYPSVAHAPEFITDKNGYVRLAVKDFTSIHSIIVKKSGMRGHVDQEHITWPLRMTIR
ncbi:MAG: hypothetical protein NTY98_27180 [Verrucomicrobia bacterium]|nr:hypothetical protein [Verrucomicrobiota bacterium]